MSRCGSRRTTRGRRLSAVGELVHGRRDAAGWLVVAAACAGRSRRRPRRRARPTATIHGSPLNVYADDTGPSRSPSTAAPRASSSPRPAGRPMPGLTSRSRSRPAQRPASRSTASWRRCRSRRTPRSRRRSPATAAPATRRRSSTTTRLNGRARSRSIHVDRALTYVNGSTDVTARYDGGQTSPTATASARRASSRPATSSSPATTAASGFFDPGPPRQVGGVNQAARQLGAPGRDHARGRHYQEGRYCDVSGVVSSSDAVGAGLRRHDRSDAPRQRRRRAMGLRRTCRWAPVADHRGDAGASAHFTPARRSPRGRRRRRRARPRRSTVTARNGDGNPDPGRAVRYAIAGANPGAGAVTTGADGTAAISWTGHERWAPTRSPPSSTQRQRHRATPTRARSRPPPSRGRRRRRRCPASRWS